ncbi:zinc-binding dehydrogenase, partial [Bacteroidota bacterium]
VGIYAALIARIFGAKVIALDIDDTKLEMAKNNGIDAVMNIKGLDIKAVKNGVREIAKELGVSRYGWKIFEVSGTKQGQELGFNLLTFTSTLSIVGFTLEKTEVRLSNLMAFDAKVIGTWGCKPELYPEVVDLIDSGKLKIDDFIETFPLSTINEVFRNTLNHAYQKRSVLVPDFK